MKRVAELYYFFSVVICFLQKNEISNSETYTSINIYCLPNPSLTNLMSTGVRSTSIGSE